MIKKTLIIPRCTVRCEKKYVTYRSKQKCTKHRTVYTMIKKKNQKNMMEYDKLNTVVK